MTLVVWQRPKKEAKQPGSLMGTARQSAHHATENYKTQKFLDLCICAVSVVFWQTIRTIKATNVIFNSWAEEAAAFREPRVGRA